MKFGKVPQLSEIDWRLPADQPRNEGYFQRFPKSEARPVFYLGCTGWSMKEWEGKVYPMGCKPAEYLKYYSRQFNTIELNTTHYRIPDIKSIRKWYEESAPDFRFCPKVPQTISHSRDLGLGGDQLPIFCASIRELKEKLGVCFLQLPPYFSPDRINLLERFLKQWPREMRLAMEFRHTDWFADAGTSTVLFNLLEAYGASAVITDVAGRRDVLHMGLSAPFVFIRFVGNDLHPSDYSRADEWVARLGYWQGRGLQEVWFFPHEPENLQAPEMSVYVCNRVQKRLPRFSVRGPRLFPGGKGGQLALFS
jgi:uncharacterized protein YecE (DUF72 family)